MTEQHDRPTTRCTVQTGQPIRQTKQALTILRAFEALSNSDWDAMFQFVCMLNVANDNLDVIALGSDSVHFRCAEAGRWPL